MGAWGAIIMSFFGAAFAALTLYWQYGVAGFTLAIPFFVFVAIGFAALQVLRRPGTGLVPSPRAERALMWAGIGEGLGLFLAGNIVMNLHRPDWLLPSMALVVGLHFLPIAWAAHFRPYFVLGAALVLAAMVGFGVQAPLGGTIAGLMAALALWTAALLAVRRDALAKAGSVAAA